MGELIAKEKSVVVPGQIIAKGMDFLPSQGTYRLNDDVLANRLGILSVEGKVLKTIPISGRYLPQRNDVIIGKVNDILMSGWRLDINSPYSAVLPLKDGSFDYIAKGADLTKYFALEDYVVVKITNVTSQNLVDVTVKGPGLRKIRGGRIIKVSPFKVPRIIGKKGSMVSMLKHATDSKIIVGQNGLMWFEGEPEMELVIVQAIKKIEDESHISGLTERVKNFLEQKTGKTIDLSSLEKESEQNTEESNEHRYERHDDRERRYDRRDSYDGRGRRDFRGGYGRPPMRRHNDNYGQGERNDSHNSFQQTQSSDGQVSEDE